MNNFFKHLPIILAVILLLTMGFIFTQDVSRLSLPLKNESPLITFTWEPSGAVDLREMRGMLRMSDDKGIDFTSYRMTLVELNKTLDLPIPGLTGKEYEQPISFSLLAGDPRLLESKKLTVAIRVADMEGAEAELVQTIYLK